MTDRFVIGVDKAAVAEIAARLGREVDQIQRLGTQAAHETASFLRERVADDLLATTRLQRDLFTRRVKPYLRSGLDARGRVFVGLFRPTASASNVGVLTQTDGGVQAGDRFFRGAFVVTLKNGFTGAFRRTGKFGRRGNPKLERIDVERIDLPSADSLIAKHELAAEVHFRTTFDRLLKAAP